MAKFTLNTIVFSKYIPHKQILRAKTASELQAMGEQSSQMALSLRKSLNQLVEELGAKARRYEEGERKIRQLGRMHVEAEQQEEQQEERIKDQMLDLMKLFKAHAKQIGHDLKRDSGVISEIGKKQETVLSDLQRENSTMSEMAKNNSLGFFKLISMASIAAVVWIFMMFFIVIF